MNVSGHRVGTAEVESALASDESIVVEAAVVAYPHEVKGEGIYAFVVVKDGTQQVTPDELGAIKVQVRESLGPFAAPDFIQVVPGLPKTRSGKIMRRVLKKIAKGDTDPSELGDLSTLADPIIVDVIVRGAVSVRPEVHLANSYSA